MGTLNDKLAREGNAVRMMYNAPTGRYAFPIAPEFTHWAEEQRAWREGVALMDQSFHMTDLYISGPDTVALLSHLAVNSFAGFGRNKAGMPLKSKEELQATGEDHSDDDGG